MSRETIKQQYYTRAREGVFRTNEGLDTVARSPSLDGNFIKKTLHPFCVYQPPRELSQRGEQDVDKYPESLTVFHADSGELVIGRSMFAGADFTGQRDTIFVHNYVVPRSRKEEFIQSPNQIFRIEHFESHYDVQNGKNLPELEELAVSRDSYLVQQRAIMDTLGVTEKIFKQMLWAITTSISSNKKVFVELNVDVEESAKYAKRLTEIMFYCLPYPLRSKFGFTTFQSQPQGKKHINLSFVEKGSIRSGDRNLDKEFLFDFPNKKFDNVELPGQEHFYLDYAWEYKDQPDTMSAFYSFAKEALQNMDEVSKLSFTTYEQLCALYLIETGKVDVYSGNKEGVLHNILKYLNPDTVALKPRLYQLFYQLVKDEAASIRLGGTVSLEYLKLIMEFFRVSDQQLKQELITYLIMFLYNAYQDNTEYVDHALQFMQQQPELFKEVISKMHSQQRFVRVFESYVAGRISSLVSVKGIQDEIEFWQKYAPELIPTELFLNRITPKVEQVLGKDKGMIEGARQLHQFIKKLSQKKHYEAFGEKVELSIAKNVLSRLELSQITATDFGNLKFMTEDPSSSLIGNLESTEKDNLNVLVTVRFILEERTANEKEIFTELDEMTAAEFEHTQNMLKKFLRDQIRDSAYQKITYAFYSKGITQFQYKDMLDYVHGGNKRSEEVYSFMIWLANNDSLEGGLKKAIRQFFGDKGKGALNNRALRRKLTKTKNARFNELLRDIKLEQSHVLTRFMVHNRKKIAVTLGGVILAVALFVGTIWIAEKLFTKKPQSSTPAPARPSTFADSKGRGHPW